MAIRMTKNNIRKNIFSHNEYENFAKISELDEKYAIKIAQDVLEFYLETDEILSQSCLVGHVFDALSFDILYCNNQKTHEINKEYRQKDYAADIITFAIFADGEEKFIFDNEINLGEIIISLDKADSNAAEKGVKFEDELYFLISHGIMHLLGFDHQTNEDYTFIVSAQNSALNKVRGEQ